jgi:hypothetical protein
MFIFNELTTLFVLLSFFIGVVKLNIQMIEKSEREHQSFKTITRNILDSKKQTTFSYSPPFSSRKFLFSRKKRGRILYEENTYAQEHKKHEKFPIPQNFN